MGRHRPHLVRPPGVVACGDHHARMGSRPGRRGELRRARARRVHRHDGARDRRVTPLVLLFDLDGTLTDPRPGIVRCLKHALDTLRAPCPSNDVLASFIGPPLRQTFGTLLETSDRDLIERAVALYRDEYGETGLFENRVYDGVIQTLDDCLEARLGSRGPSPATARSAHHARALASAAFVATLKPKLYADRIVQRLELEPYFAGVYGTELEGRFDDKADLIAHLLATEKVQPERAVMIGDRSGDVVGARANRVRSIGVLWGYGSRSELESAGADGLCGSPAELAACLGRLAP